MIGPANEVENAAALAGQNRQVQFSGTNEIWKLASHSSPAGQGSYAESVIAIARASHLMHQQVNLQFVSQDRRVLVGQAACMLMHADQA